ncbi:MAG TPA: hypothetical protein VFA15_07855 [Nitrososphaera sp.]|nr:hypothetical protein [Nitrososphaera sp.]
MSSRESLELGIGSIGKMKIIRALAGEAKLATIYLLHKKTHLKRDDIRSNLDDLVKIGWVKQSKLANIMYSLDRENEVVQCVLEFFDEVGYTDQP